MWKKYFFVTMILTVLSVLTFYSCDDDAEEPNVKTETIKADNTSHAMIMDNAKWFRKFNVHV